MSIDQQFLSLTGRYDVDPADAEAFSALALATMRNTAGKPGCLYYIVSRDLVRPGVFHLSEGWTDQAALDAHLASADFAETMESMGKLRVLDREVFVSQSTGLTPLFDH